MIFFTNYFLSVPDAFIENAVTEGAGYLKILWRIILPMAVPALVTIGVLDFLLVWNDLLVALLFLPQPDHQTASVLLATINAGRTPAHPGRAGRRAAQPGAELHRLPGWPAIPDARLLPRRGEVARPRISGRRFDSHDPGAFRPTRA